MIDLEWDTQVDEATIDVPKLPDVYDIGNERVCRAVDAAVAQQPYFNIGRDAVLASRNSHEKVYAHLIRIEPQVFIFLFLPIFTTVID